MSNPPYVADGEPGRRRVGADWEPHGALFAGPDGLDALRRSSPTRPRWLVPGGWLVLEIGADQGAGGRRAADRVGLAEVEIRPDLAGRDRVAVARIAG